MLSWWLDSHYVLQTHLEESYIFTPPQPNNARNEKQKPCQLVRSQSNINPILWSGSTPKSFNNSITTLWFIYSDNMETDTAENLTIYPTHLSHKVSILSETFLGTLVSDRFLLSEYLKNNYLQHHFILLWLQILFARHCFSFTKYYQFHMLLLPRIAIK